MFQLQPVVSVAGNDLHLSDIICLVVWKCLEDLDYDILWLSIIYGISSSQLTNSMIFQRGGEKAPTSNLRIFVDHCWMVLAHQKQKKTWQLLSISHKFWCPRRGSLSSWNDSSPLAQWWELRRSHIWDTYPMTDPWCWYTKIKMLT